MAISDQKIKIGIVGLGFGQRVHVPSFRTYPSCEIAGVFSGEPGQAKEVAEKIGAGKSFDKWEDIVSDPLIDAVSIATPPSVQPAIAIAALGNKKAVFCEKPMASSLEDAAAMALAAEKSGMPNMIDFEFPAINIWQEARGVIDRGDIGALRHVVVSWHLETYANRNRLTSWKTSREKGGGTLNSFLPHVFHYLEWFAGPVKGLSARLFSSPKKDMNGDTFDSLSIQFGSGAAASVSVSTDSFLGDGHRIDFHGDDGTLVLHNPTSEYVRGFRLFLGTRSGDKLETVSVDEDVPGDISDDRIIPVSRVIGKFLGWIETGTPRSPDFSAGLRVQKLMDMAAESDRSGQWVSFP